MGITLEKIVPFGRSLDEYQRLFALTSTDLQKYILAVADGPASFNAEMTALGRQVVSMDPLYVYSGEEIEKQFYAVVDNIIDQVRATPDTWVWTYHRSPDHLRENRVRVLRRFRLDYAEGKAAGRYRIGELPKLELADQAFQLALCSHFLFLYSDHLSYAFHQAAIEEMLRVAEEVRIFPLLTLNLTPSPYVDPLVHEFKSRGFAISIEKVDYELQKGGNQMLRISKTI